MAEVDHDQNRRGGGKNKGVKKTTKGGEKTTSGGEMGRKQQGRKTTQE